MVGPQSGDDDVVVEVLDTPKWIELRSPRQQDPIEVAFANPTDMVSLPAQTPPTTQTTISGISEAAEDQELIMADPVFLAGVPAEHVMARLAQADGDEIKSGKIFSPDSSAFLAVNTFGWFIPHPALIPAFPGLENAYPATMVEVEFKARFPWRGGRHPSLDAVVETSTQMIGVESKRYEPFRDTKSVDFSDAYDRPVWGDSMRPYEILRDQLRGDTTRFRYLDACQLVKHAFGLVSEGRRRSKAPVLVYLFAEPAQLGRKDIGPDAIARHRAEVMEFEQSVAGAEVAFHRTSYRDWITTWRASADTVIAHGQRLLDAFRP